MHAFALNRKRILNYQIILFTFLHNKKPILMSGTQEQQIVKTETITRDHLKSTSLRLNEL